MLILPVAALVLRGTVFLITDYIEQLLLPLTFNLRCLAPSKPSRRDKVLVGHRDVPAIDEELSV